MTNERHPFLVCERSQFPDLRDRASREPWATMAADARERVEAGMDDGDEQFSVRLNRHVGARALLYVLDPDRRREHAERVHDAIADRLPEAAFDPDQDWRGTVPPLGAAFVSILALDVVYDDLTTAEVERCETTIGRQIDTLDRTGSWPAARLGTFGTWDVYNGDRTDPDDAFYENYVGQMTADGVTTVSPGYAFARLGSGDDRPQKTGYADVLEFTGIDERYYDDPRLARFYRWLYGASVNPAGEYHLFGDVAPNWTHPNAALMWRVGRFDERAAAHAAWLLADADPPGHLLSYVLVEDPLPDPAVPRSQLFEDGGAAFRDPADDPRGLGSALYNVTENAEWHTHEEVNAVACSAGGNRLLVNGGWLGPETRPPWRNNTLAVDGERHERRTGAGLVEGLLADGFDYACGDSGDALGDHAFQRSLVQVHGGADRGGYVAVFDEVDAAPGSSIHAYLQVATESDPRVRVPRREYRAAIDHHAAVDGVELTVLYGTEPRSVTTDLLPSGTLERNPEAGKHYRLAARYEADRAGDRRLVTVLVPHARTRDGPDMAWIGGDGYTGATVAFADVTDLLFESDGDERIDVHGVSARARAVVCRQGGDQFYFARRATAFRRGPRGFESSAPVSVFVRGSEGRITSPDGAEVTLQHPGVTGVCVDGEAVDSAETSGDRVRFQLPPGRHGVSLETVTDPPE